MLKNLYAIIFALLFFVPFQTEATDWYLDVNAKGENNGTSNIDAWQSVSEMDVSSFSSGDVLWVEGGIYNEAFRISSIANGVSVKIYPDATEQAVFHDCQLYNTDDFVLDAYLNGRQMIKCTKQHPTMATVFNLRQANTVVVRGVEINRDEDISQDTKQSHGMRIWDQSSDVLVQNCKITNTSGDGINISQINQSDMEEGDFDWVHIDNNIITEVGDDGIQAATTNVTVSNNYIDNNFFPTYFGGHPDGFQLNPDGHHVKIYNNTFRGFNQNVFIEYATSDVYIYNNVFIGIRNNSPDRGITSAVRESFTGTFLVLNNTFYNFVSYFAWNGHYVEGSIVGNNIFYNCKLITSDPDNSINSIYYDEEEVQYYTSDGSPVDIIYDRFIGNAVYQDPGFESLETLKLSSDSQSIGAAVSYSSYFNYDKDNNMRDSFWDLGAYEYSHEEETTEENYRADVNNDLSIDKSDALLIFRKSLGLSMSDTMWQSSDTTGDVNCDYQVNIRDAWLIMRYTWDLSMENTAWCIQ